MSGINFKGVEEAKEVVMTRPGTIDVFDIKNVKFDTSKNKGTYYMQVTFARKADEFNHSFFLTEKALPRLKSLVKAATGTALEDEIMEEALVKMLQGKKVALKVSANIDEENGRAYPNLSFGGFARNPEKVKELAFSDQEEELIARAKSIRAKDNTADADPADKATAKPAAAGAKADEDVF